jgi:two-component system, chemotaxis family, chemotaxis protein CheY
MAMRARILIVDDYDSMRALVQRYLERSCHAEIHAVRDPLEALSLARRERFDLIISDYEMPGMNGLEFLAEIRADPMMTSTRFIMLTCSDDRELVRQAIALGVDEYHTKPIAQKTLERTMQKLGGTLAGGLNIGAVRNGRFSPGHIAPLRFGRAGEMAAAA